MPEPASPVAVGLEEREGVVAKDHPDFLPLPVLVKRSDGGQRTVICRWELDEVDRDKIAAGADVFVEIMLIGNVLAPTCVRIMDRWNARYEIEGEGY